MVECKYVSVWGACIRDRQIKLIYILLCFTWFYLWKLNNFLLSVPIIIFFSLIRYSSSKQTKKSLSSWHDVIVAERNARCRHGTWSVPTWCSSSVTHVRVVTTTTAALGTPAPACVPSTGEPFLCVPVLSACTSWRAYFDAASDVVIRYDVISCLPLLKVC